MCCVTLSERTPTLPSSESDQQSPRGLLPLPDAIGDADAVVAASGQTHPRSQERHTLVERAHGGEMAHAHLRTLAHEAKDPRKDRLGVERSHQRAEFVARELDEPVVVPPEDAFAP